MQNALSAREIATVILSTLVETLDPVPEGHLYAALMGATNLDRFQNAVGALKKVGMLEQAPGSRFLLVATDKARALPWPPLVKVVKPAATAPQHGERS